MSLKFFKNSNAEQKSPRGRVQTAAKFRNSGHKSSGLRLISTYSEFESHKIEFPSICKHFEKLFIYRIEWIHLFAGFSPSDNFAQYEIDP